MKVESSLELEMEACQRFLVLTDLHLSSKPWQVRKALLQGRDYDAVLISGDITNDGTQAQMELFWKCVTEVITDVPVLAVAGNHDYPARPLPRIDNGICDYPALQGKLLERAGKLGITWRQHASGAYWAVIGDTEVIGLNAVSHWRRFVFHNGEQLTWLESYLKESRAKRHVILCHAPLLAHNPKRSDTKPYLSRDAHLQQIIDGHENIIFISGHTHVSLESPVPCVEWDEKRNNIYINSGSIRPTTVLTKEGLPEREPAAGNVVEILLTEECVSVVAVTLKTGERNTPRIRETVLHGLRSSRN